MAHASPASSPAASTSATAGRASSRRNQPRRRWLHLLGRPRATVTSPVAAIAGRASARAPSQPLLLSASWPTAAVPSAGNLLSPPSLRAPCCRRVTSRRPPAIAIVPPRVLPGLTPPRPHHRHRDGLSCRELALSRSGPNLAAGGGCRSTSGVTGSDPSATPVAATRHARGASPPTPRRKLCHLRVFLVTSFLVGRAVSGSELQRWGDG